MLRPDVTLHLLADRVVARRSDGLLVELRTPDPPALASALKSGLVPEEVATTLAQNGLSGPADAVAGSGAPLPRLDGPVLVVGGGVAAQAAAAALASLAQGHERCAAVPPSQTGPEAAGRPAVVLLALDWWDVQTIESWNAEAHARRQPWLAAGPAEGRRILVGPLVVPGETACYACYLARRTANAWRPDAFEAHLSALRAGSLDPPPIELWAQAAGRLGAWEAARMARGAVPASLGTAVTFGIDGLDTTHDRVPKAPRCPVCSRHQTVPPVEPWMPVPRGEPSRNS